MVLLALVSLLGWLVVATFVVAVCRAGARGDRRDWAYVNSVAARGARPRVELREHARRGSVRGAREVRS